MPRKSDSQQVTNALLSQQLNSLSDTVTVGFKGVHERQDIANSKTATNISDIIKLKERFLLGNALWFVITVLVGLVVWMVR